VNAPRHVLRACAAAALALCSCASPPPRQAVLTLELEPGAQQQLRSLTVTALDPEGSAYGATAELDLGADYARSGRPSLGVVPWEDGQIRVRIRGADAEQGTVLEQLAVAPTRDDGITPITVIVREVCLGALPCEVACDEDGARGFAECAPAPACELGTLNHCAACGDKCAEDHSATRCERSQCILDCAEGYADCDGDQRGTGCETNVREDPKHCGECGRRCPYGVCVDDNGRGRCAVSCAPGALAALGEDEPEWLSPQRLHLQLVAVEPDAGGRLAGVGVHVDATPLEPNIPFRVAVYAHDAASELPGRLLASTGEQYTLDAAQAAPEDATPCAAGALEVPTNLHPSIEGGGLYWVAIVPSAQLRVRHSPLLRWSRLQSFPERDYALFETMPEYPYLRDTGLRPVDAPALHVFLIVTPD
jgi:hypothetical protein